MRSLGSRSAVYGARRSAFFGERLGRSCSPHAFSPRLLVRGGAFIPPGLPLHRMRLGQVALASICGLGMLCSPLVSETHRTGARASICGLGKLCSPLVSEDSRIGEVAFGFRTLDLQSNAEHVAPLRCSKSDLATKVPGDRRRDLCLQLGTTSLMCLTSGHTSNGTLLAESAPDSSVGRGGRVLHGSAGEGGSGGADNFR